ncbi:MFS transporter [Rhodothermus marinus]|uniref:MFS transporter n=1 Tax=Rhodothermus marinus TaxID=29549 RepID=UPI0012BA4D3D|nr:MFS transporter [Rhodothermus marinus]BBM69388.1 hexuronate transporter [Rhodothermus marinus]BBM72371.1 hexuronate transporter [Rhodothermus marinus]
MRKVKGLRWWIISLIAIATVINYIDRGALSILWPNISADLGMTKEDYSLIAIMFTIAYAISQTLSGRLYDWVGTRLGFVISITVWSISIALHAIARSVTSFSIFRFLLGLGEAGNWPGATKAVAEWFPIKDRALAQGIFNAGASIGSIISPPLIAFLYLWLGWQATFVVLGGLGLLWLIPWVIVYKALPDRHPWLTEEERQYILSGQKIEDAEAEDERVPGFWELLSYKQTWSVLVSRFFLDPIWWLFVFWLPIYLHDRFGFDIQQIGLSAWVPYVGAAAGALFGGWYAGFLMRRGWTVDKARKWAITLGGLIMLPGLLLTSIAAHPVVAVLLIAVVLFGFQVSIGNIQTLPSDFYSGKAVGSVAGMGGTTAALGVIITTWLVPKLVVASYVPFFLMGAMLVPLGVLSVYVLGGRIRRVPLRRRP